MENLRQLAAEELDNISRLEGDICVELYGTRANQGQCSVLENNQVIAATQYPNLLARDVKTRITLMNDVLKMMSKTKMHHMEKLKVLQDHAQRNDEEEDEDDDSWEQNDGDEEERQRESERLASKPRRNFTRFNKYGFE